MRQDTAAQLSALFSKLRKDRAEHAAAIAEIDAVLDTVGNTTVAAPKRGPGRPKGSKNKTKKKAGKKAGTKNARTKKSGKKRAPKGRGLKKGGSRVQGVKQTLEDALTGTPQSPADLQAKVSKALGHDVAVATQLHMLKREGKAKTVGRGQWVKG